MDKLEHYLDQVCRSVGGPRSLRQHIRQELREHLRDAMAEHKAAGLSEEQALDRALGEFGKPEDVRSELEATHGHRLMAVVIDKAMQWKETTMRAKWLWASWAHLALALVIVLELLFITFTVVFIIPKFQMLLREGLLDPEILNKEGVSWMPWFLVTLKAVAGRYTTWLLLGAAVAWGLFEWRVQSENKPLIRLSMLGTTAAALIVVVALTAGALVVSFCLSMPETGRLARPFALDQISRIDASMRALAQAKAKKDWEAMQDQAERASRAIAALATAAPAVPALAKRSEPSTVAKEQEAIDEMRANVKTASEDLAVAQHAIRDKDTGALETALRKFHQSYVPVQTAAKRPGR
jgi:hypothetical protein